ncbi:MAG: acyl carrier protein [Chloroflexi bacterium]|nr:acyl carrier protein [Chloroflexota bacterium]
METTDTQITDKVRDVLAATFNVDASEVSPELEFGDLPQWDSMGHMDVMMALEESFGFEINAETISDLTSIALIVEHVNRKK